MAPRLDPVAASPALPARVEAVVVGGGIVGASAALALAEQGVPVALCEKGEVGGEQSGRNWGWVRKMGRDPAEIPLAIESVRLWERMNRRVGAETGFRRTGILYLSAGSAETAKHEAWLERARPFQLDTRLIGAAEIDALLPGAGQRWTSGLYTASDGVAEPQQAAPAIANAAARHGAAILTGCAVRGVETEAGRVSGVVTDRGPIRCDAVVLAAGAWSRLFCGNMGVDFPQLKVLSSVMRSEPVAGLPELAVGAGDFAFRRRLDGGYTIARRNLDIVPIVPDSFRLFGDYLPALRTQWRQLRLRVGRRFIEEWRVPRRWALDQPSPFETVRILDPAPSAAILDQGRRQLVKSFPAFATVGIAERWAGLIDVTPDAVPVISPVAGVPGFFIASGFSGHGFGIGPGAGRLAADLVTGATPIVDPAPYRYERFLGRT